MHSNRQEKFSNDQTVSSDIKGNVDVDLTLGVWREYKNYDKAIIISGDGDFSSLIHYLLENNKLKKVIVPEFYSALFKQFDKYIIEINDYKDMLVYEPKKKTAAKIPMPMPNTLTTTKRQKVRQILKQEIQPKPKSGKSTSL